MQNQRLHFNHCCAQTIAFDRVAQAYGASSPSLADLKTLSSLLNVLVVA